MTRLEVDLEIMFLKKNRIIKKKKVSFRKWLWIFDYITTIG
jgi:hypothetical protein|tara:strand:+ start:210 stop:332 length:123 start_codon:yes stop_codon:yes gene_type:complete